MHLTAFTFDHPGDNILYSKVKSVLESLTGIFLPSTIVFNEELNSWSVTSLCEDDLSPVLKGLDAEFGSSPTMTIQESTF